MLTRHLASYILQLSAMRELGTIRDKFVPAVGGLVGSEPTN